MMTSSMGSSAPVVKQQHLTEGSYINVEVVSQRSQVDSHFWVRRDYPLQQLLISWCVRANIKDYHTVLFLLDNKRIGENQTPDEIGLEDGDCIDATTEQIVITLSMDSSAAAVKQKPSTEVSYINVKVICNLNGINPCFFRVRCDHRLQLLMISWCVRVGIEDYRSVCFVYDGKKIEENQTPNEIGMKNDDFIAVRKQQHSTDDSYINVEIVYSRKKIGPHFFRVRRDDSLKLLMINWCVRVGIKDYRTIQFAYDGMRIGEDETPDQIGMENYAFIDVVKQEHLIEDSHINVKVACYLKTMDPYFFRVRRDDLLKLLMINWCARVGIEDYRTILFVYDGKRIGEDETPDEIGLSNGDCIGALFSDVVRQEDSTRGSYVKVHVLSLANAIDPQYFSVRRDDPLQLLFINWCDQVGMDDYRKVRFIGRDCKTIKGNQTPNEIGLSNGDCIHAILCRRAVQDD